MERLWTGVRFGGMSCGFLRCVPCGRFGRNDTVGSLALVEMASGVRIGFGGHKYKDSVALLQNDGNGAGWDVLDDGGGTRQGSPAGFPVEIPYGG